MLLLEITPTSLATIPPKARALVIGEQEVTLESALITNRTNHTVETCFLKHVYPPRFRGKGKTPSSNSRSQFVASVETGQTSPRQQFTPSMVGSTQEQYQSILELSQRSKTNPKANSIYTSPFVLSSQSNHENGKNPLF